MFKERSKLFFGTCILQVILSIWALFYFNYLDRRSYEEHSLSDLALLIENIFTNTWWALIILAVALITIFALVAFIYKDLKFQFMAICLWIVLFILAVDFQASVGEVFSTLAIFMPLIILNIFCYFNQKKLFRKK